MTIRHMAAEPSEPRSLSHRLRAMSDFYNLDVGTFCRQGDFAFAQAQRVFPEDLVAPPLESRHIA